MTVINDNVLLSAAEEILQILVKYRNYAEAKFKCGRSVKCLPHNICMLSGHVCIKYIGNYDGNVEEKLIEDMFKFLMSSPYLNEGRRYEAAFWFDYYDGHNYITKPYRHRSSHLISSFNVRIDFLKAYINHLQNGTNN